MMPERLIFAFLFIFVLCACDPQPSDQLMREPSDGVLTVTKHPGGVISDIWARFEELADAMVSVRVAGGCYSACTMSLSELLPLNCSTWGAVYHFHGAAAVQNGRVIQEIDDRANTMWQVLPNSVQDALPPPEDWVSTRWNVLTARDLDGVQGSGFRHCA